MKTDFILNGTNLFVGVLITDPDTEVGEDPTVATATFYQLDSSGDIQLHSLGTVNLVQVGGQTGFWGVVVDVTNGISELDTLFVFVSAIVGGNVRADFESVVNILEVGGPTITKTPGVGVHI